MNSEIAFYVYSISISPGGSVVKVIGVIVIILVPWSTSGVYGISIMHSSFDAGISYKIGKPTARS